MTFPAAAPLTLRADAVDVFCARCAAQARLCIAGYSDLIEAVDELQASPVKAGLVRRLGQNTIPTTRLHRVQCLFRSRSLRPRVWKRSFG
jgi:hypothetical protein